MCHFHKKLGTQGNFAVDGLVLTTVAAISISLLLTAQYRATSQGKRSLETQLSAKASSAINTMLPAYDVAEIHYSMEIAKFLKCGGPATFVKALKDGHGCPGEADITVFTIEDLREIAHKIEPGIPFVKLITDSTYIQNMMQLYSYAGSVGCTIKSDSSTCKGTQPKLIEIGVDPKFPHQSDHGTSISFYLLNENTGAELTEWIAEAHTPTSDPKQSQVTKTSFGINSQSPNLVHLEGDGRVTQERPDPLDPCKSSPWSTYFLYSPERGKCETYEQMGSGTGLAYYKNRFFGFRPADGQVIDLANLSEGGKDGSYMVEETTGKLTHASDTDAPVFVPYKKELLTNADDITLIGDQLYYVAGQGESAYIGVLYAGKNAKGDIDVKKMESHHVCDLGKMGWSQSYTGIASPPWSMPLIPETGDQLNLRIAHFFLKTDSGDLLTATVIGVGTDKNTDIGKGIPYNTEIEGLPLCIVTKNPDLQPVEYKRSMGFDRTRASKRYFAF